MYNNFMIQNTLNKYVIYTIDVWSNESTIYNLQKSLHYPNFNKIKTALVGCLVMQTVNINLENGLANKTPTSIWSINLDFQGQANSIILTINHSSKSLRLEQCTIQYNYIFNKKFNKLTFPWAKVYATTWYECYGATICSKVLVNVCKAISSSLTYVILSKVTKKRHLKIAC